MKVAPVRVSDSRGLPNPLEVQLGGLARHRQESGKTKERYAKMQGETKCP